MRKMQMLNVALLIHCLFIIGSAQKLSPAEIVAKHLESLGGSGTLASVKSRIVIGDAVVTFMSQKNMSSRGRIVLASTAEKNFFGLKLDALDYPTERFSFDGNKSRVDFVRNSTRSPLGSFILSNNLLLEESLLGGVLSTSWSLASLDSKKVKLLYEGVKKIDGKETFALGYAAKGLGDLDVTLYFDKETFRHVRTEYKRIASAAIGRTIDESARQIESRFKLTEDFSNFKTVKGMSLPNTYTLLYSVSGQNGTTEIKWSFDLTQFDFNIALDNNTFVFDVK